MENEQQGSNSEREALHRALKLAGRQRFGVVDSNFLAQSVSTLSPRQPVCVSESLPVKEVIVVLQQHRIGCVLVTNERGTLTGIFSERDCILKILSSPGQLSSPVHHFMTRNPVAEAPDITVAYALNLMSQGGFRHLPLIDEHAVPVGMISIKDVVDYIVGTLTEDLLAYELPHA